MEDIKVGNFIRTNNGHIGELIRIERDDIDTSLKWYVFNDGKNERYVNKPYIINYSKNIIDLIEAGDVLKIHFPVRNTIRKIYVDEYFEDSMILNGIINGNVILKSILTHEQYKQNCYTVERKENKE